MSDFYCPVPLYRPGAHAAEAIWVSSRQAPEFVETEGFVHGDHVHWTARFHPTGPDKDAMYEVIYDGSCGTAA